MIALEIQGFTRALGAPIGWDEQRDGECFVLKIVDTQTELGTPVMISAWRPTSDEVDALLNGAPVYLQIVGHAHPPVNVFVGAAAEHAGDRHNNALHPMLSALCTARTEAEQMVLLESLVLGCLKANGRTGRDAALFCETLAERLIQRDGSCGEVAA